MQAVAVHIIGFLGSRSLGNRDQSTGHGITPLLNLKRPHINMESQDTPTLHGIGGLSKRRAGTAPRAKLIDPGEP